MPAQDYRQPRNVQALVDTAVAELREAGVEDARLNAEMLLGHVLGWDRAKVQAHPERIVGDTQRRRFMDLVLRRSAREPLQYLLGRWEFHGREFVITPSVMVPRPETELLVATCLEALEPGRRAWAADIGTGSGVVAVSLAASRPELHVIATDTSEKALETAALNAARHRVSQRVIMAKGHLAQPVREHLPPGRDGVELVASNPPYVPTEDLESLQPEVRQYEPSVALDGGPDGLEVIRRLIPQATDVLLPGGLLALEIGQGQARTVEELIQQTGAYVPDTVVTAEDHAGIERVVSARKRTE